MIGSEWEISLMLALCDVEPGESHVAHAVIRMSTVRRLFDHEFSKFRSEGVPTLHNMIPDGV